jgi:hypothetical protein
MTTQEMMRAKARPGFFFTDIAPMNEPADWREVPSPHGPHSDPNYGFGTIFGYDQAAFLKRQHR